MHAVNADGQVSFFYDVKKVFQNPHDTTHFFTKDSLSEKGYTLIFINKDSEFNPHVKQQLIKTFFTVYPEEAERFNKKTAKKVTFIIDPDYKGVAATSGAVTRFNPRWFKKHPNDIDVVTHEVMHIVQDYHSRHTPGWLTEGIADYARYIYGIHNNAADWALPAYNPKQSYKDAYRVTARFLVWLQKNISNNIVDKLNKILHKGTYTQDTWKKLTGKTVDELWKMYAKSPSLHLHYH
jgi:predicted metal-dependent peptidase